MATATRKAKSKAKPKATVLQLVMFLDTVSYVVKPLRSDMHRRAFTLKKADGERYHLGQHEDGFISCSCADATFRDRECKHGRALRAAGLFD